MDKIEEGKFSMSDEIRHPSRWPERFRTGPWSLMVVLLVIFCGLAIIYGVTVPLWEAPDEVGHFGYVLTLLRTHKLPLQQLNEPGEAHQPPLYYVLAALPASTANLDGTAHLFRLNPEFLWAGQGGKDINISLHGSIESFPFRGTALAFHLVRGVSILMGMATVVLTLSIGWEVFRDWRAVGALGAALVALNSQFLFISSVVNNDNLLIVLATAAWWQLLRVLREPERVQLWIGVGILGALAILAKTSGVVIVFVAGIVLLTCALKRQSLRLFAQGSLAIVLPVILVTGWWFYRNQVLYGDPLGWTVYRQVFAVNLRHSPLQWCDLRDFFSVQFRSFWGVFGWMNLPMPSWLYGAFRILCLLSLLGLGLFALRGQFSKLSRFQRKALILLGFIVLAQEAYMIGIITRCNASCYQGRYIFPIIAPLMIIMSLGLNSLLPKRLTVSLATGISLALMAVALFVPFGVIEPTYRTVPVPKWRLWFVPQRTSFVFADTFELLGYEAKPDVISSQLSLTLYWKALRQPDFDYSAFVHLIDGANQLVAQKDHAPGESLGYPPRSWWPGDIIADEHILELPDDLGPATYRFRVGLYNWATQEQLPIASSGESAGSFIILDQHWSY